jgi:Ca2+-transporting ATPase
MAYRRGMPETEVRALTFFSLVTVIVALIFLNRSFSASLLAAFRRPNGALKFVLTAVVAILGLSLFWPVAANLFRFGPLHADDLAISFGAGFIVLVVLELLKPHWRANLRS